MPRLEDVRWEDERGGRGAYIWDGLRNVGEEACSGSGPLGGTSETIVRGSGGESLGRTALHSGMRRREKLETARESELGFDGDRMRHRLGIELTVLNRTFVLLPLLPLYSESGNSVEAQGN